MTVPEVAKLLPILQTAIGPVILISGVGLLLMSMTNRLGRAIDRARILDAELERCDAAKKPKVKAQLRILWERARLIRFAITLAALSALSSALLVIVIFLTAAWSLNASWLIAILFCTSLACLIGALVTFIYDINRSLAALKLELDLERLQD